MEYFRCLCYCDSTIRFSLFIDALAVILRGGRIVVVGIWIHTAKKRKSIHIRAAAVIPPSLLVEVASEGIGAAGLGKGRIAAGVVIDRRFWVEVVGVGIGAAGRRRVFAGAIADRCNLVIVEGDRIHATKDGCRSILAASVVNPCRRIEIGGF